jgi:cytochrome P450
MGPAEVMREGVEGDVQQAITSWPAGPPGRRLSGNLKELLGDRLGFLRACAREYGDFVPMRVRGKDLILINDPAYIEIVTMKRPDDYSKNFLSDFFHPVLKRQLLLSESGSWLEQRRLAQPDFRHDRLTRYTEIMVEKARRTCDDLVSGRPVDVASVMRRLTLEILASSLFDIEIAEEAEEAGSIVDLVLDDVGNRVMRGTLVPFVMPTRANIRLLRALRRLDVILDELIATRRLTAAGRADLLSRLVTKTDADGRPASDRDVKFTALPLFFAGHETTAVMLTWALHVLSLHPEVERCLVEELDRVLGDRPATMADLQSLPYTGWVVNETLRLYPPIWGFGREAVRATEIGPYRIPAGTNVFASQWVIHRDPRYYERPEEFLPERWADGLARRLPRAAYMPFGLGPRRCLGSTFAQLEATLVLATVCRRFRFSAVEGPGPVMEPLITLRPKGGLTMVPLSR